MENIYKKLLDHSSKESFAHKWRSRRFDFFISLLKSINKKPINILDVGGTLKFWINMGLANNENYKITILNLDSQGTILTSPLLNCSFKIGDGTDLKDFVENSIDVVFSNSVIEHVGSFSEQTKMALEVRRVAKRYFVQTPNKYFPIEPHFHWPYFQFYPKKLGVVLATQIHSIGWYHNAEDVYQIRLMSKDELRHLFPNANITKEKFLGMTKSFIVYSGFDE